MTVEQYIILVRSKKEKDGKVAIRSKEELASMRKWWEKKQNETANIEMAERMYEIYTGENLCELI